MRATLSVHPERGPIVTIHAGSKREIPVDTAADGVRFVLRFNANQG